MSREAHAASALDEERRRNGETPRDQEGERFANVPVDIGPTSVRRHITGSFALNIPNAPLDHGGDWHQCGAWFTTEPETVQETAFTNEEEYRPLLNRLGRRGLRDARAGLKRLNHPGGEQPTKIWAATYDRAALEIAWRWLQKYGPRRGRNMCPPIDSRELARWLPYPHQWIRLHWYAWRLRNDLDGEKLQEWDAWRRSWWPWVETVRTHI